MDGEIEAGKLYREADFNPIVEIKEREAHRVELLLSQINQNEKTLVFCATQDHALAVRDLINQKKASKDPNYCQRVTANDGALGEQHLRDFQDNEKTIPAILTTSQKLSTGVDARKRSGQGWAIRNIKLRMSRKLIYISGLLACYQCHLDHTPEGWQRIVGSPDRQEQVVDYFQRVFQQTPLEIVSGILLRYPHLDTAAVQIIGSYNDFLGILADGSQRVHLDTLNENMAENDEVYQRARKLSHSFRDGLLKLFFDTESEMDQLTKNYGVF